MEAVPGHLEQAGAPEEDSDSLTNYNAKCKALDFFTLDFYLDFYNFNKHVT